MKKETVYNYVLNDREFGVVKRCLDYCLHRYAKHPESGITKALKLEHLQTLIRDIEKLI